MNTTDYQDALSLTPGGAHAPLRVTIATPLGKGGRGGMDRLTDLVVAELLARASGSIEATRLVTRGPRGLPFSAWFFSVAVVKLIFLVFARRIDVLHIHLAAGGSTFRKSILSRIAHFADIPVVVHVHSGRFADYWRDAPPAAARRIVRLLATSSRIIVLCRAHGAVIAERLPAVSERIAVLANATPIRPRGKTAGEGEPVTIAFLGVLARTKGVDDLIAALGGLSTRTPWKAVLAGYGDVDGYQRQAAGHAIADRVTFPGWVDSAGVDALLARTDILVLPSYSEGLPMVILEAFAAGIPVVATPLPAIREVVQEGRNGCLVAVGDKSALAAALTRLIENATLRRTLGDAGRADHAARFAIEPYVEKLVALWRALDSVPARSAGVAAEAEARL